MGQTKSLPQAHIVDNSLSVKSTAKGVAGKTSHRLEEKPPKSEKKNKKSNRREEER